jgi:hypothetical protein
MEDKFTKLNFMKISQESLDFQLKALYPIRVSRDPVRVNLVFLNHNRNFSSFLTIMYLVEHGRVADIYSLSRSMFESVISMGLLSKHLIQEDLERYQDFQYIGIYRTYNHLKQIGLERLSGVSPSQLDFLYSKRNEYLRKWGRSTSNWTGKSLEHNVKLVDRAYAPTCNEKLFYEYLYCQVYRKGSQAVHSSFAGLAKGVNIEKFTMHGTTVQRFKPDEGTLVFSCFHSLLAFLSSVRFLGYLTDRKETEDYFHKMASYIISDE